MQAKIVGADPVERIMRNARIVTDRLSHYPKVCSATDFFKQEIKFQYQDLMIQIPKRLLLNSPDYAISVILTAYCKDLYKKETGARLITTKYYDWLKTKAADLEKYLQLESELKELEYKPDSYTLFLEEKIREQSLKQ